MDFARLYGIFALAAIAVATAIALPFLGYGAYSVVAWTAAAVLAAAGVVPHSPRYGILAGSLVATGASAYLFWLKVSPSPGQAICTVNAVIECESINNSPASVLFGGSALEVPITLLGAGFFAGLVGATLWAPGKTPRLFQVASLFALVNVLVSLYLGSVLITEAKFCVFCVSIYASNLVVLWGGLAGLARHGPGLFVDLGSLVQSRSLWTVATTFFVVVIGGKVGLVPPPEPTEPVVLQPGAPVDLKRYYTAAPGVPELDGSEPAVGPEGARYTVVEFADYACPHCAEASEQMAKWMPKQTDVRLYFKVFPLTKDCNPAIPEIEPSNFPQRCIPALYAECAAQFGRFWEVNHDIFTNQRELANAGFSLEDMDLLVKNRGVDPTAIRPCLESTDARRGVAMDAIAGARAGVGGTPAFFIQGITDDGTWVMPVRGVEDAIRLIEAHRATTPPPAPAGGAAPAGGPATEGGAAVEDGAPPAGGAPAPGPAPAPPAAGG